MDRDSKIHKTGKTGLIFNHSRIKLVLENLELENLRKGIVGKEVNENNIGFILDQMKDLKSNEIAAINWKL